MHKQTSKKQYILFHRNLIIKQTQYPQTFFLAGLGILNEFNDSIEVLPGTLFYRKDGPIPSTNAVAYA